MARKPYNGHESWNAWNVALWIGNDEALYCAARDCLMRWNSKGARPSLTLATNRFLQIVGQDSRTPDGARYSFRSVYLALAGIAECLTFTAQA